MATAVAIQPLAPRPSPMTFATTPLLKTTPKSSRATLKALGSGNGTRVRKERPCDGCRRRKSKCVLQENLPCVLCEFHKQDCTFVEAAQPRKRKAEDPAKNPTPSKSPKRSLAITNAPDTTKRTDSVISPGKPAAAPTPRTDDLTILDDTLSLQRHRHCLHVGRSSALDTSLLGLSNFDPNHEISLVTGDVRRVTGDDFFTMLPDNAFSTYQDELQSLYAVEQLVAPHGPALVDLYFRNAHPAFPIIQKQVFLNRHRLGDRQFNSALLAGMYLLALRWWDQDPVLAMQQKPSVKALEEVGFRSLSIAMQRPKLSALQAGLLLLQRQPTNTWTLTVQLVALAQDLGLHLDCSSWTIPLWERRLRKRLAWALYIQDKWSALVNGRPSHIQATDWAVPQLTSMDFAEEVTATDDAPAPTEEDQEDANSRVVFIQMIELTAIMGEVIDVFYTQKAIAEFDRAGKQATPLILAKAKPVQLKLKEWFARLPPVARMDSFAPGTLSSNGCLHLAYFATEISIHRRIVQSLDPATSDPYMLYICRSAAKTRLISAMDFVNRLRVEHLDSFWYSGSSANFALIATFGNLLRATAPGQEETLFYESRLQEYRWALSVSSRRAEWIENAVKMLDVTNSMLGKLPEKPNSFQLQQQQQQYQQQQRLLQKPVRPAEIRVFDDEDDSEDMDEEMEE